MWGWRTFKALGLLYCCQHWRQQQLPRCLAGLQPSGVWQGDICVHNPSCPSLLLAPLYGQCSCLVTDCACDSGPLCAHTCHCVLPAGQKSGSLQFCVAACGDKTTAIVIDPIALAAVVLLTLIMVFGVKESFWFNVATVIISVIAILLCIFMGK